MKIYVITGTDIKETGQVSWKFMFDSGSDYDDYSGLSDTFGYLQLRDRGNNELDPFALGRMMCGETVDKPVIGPNGIQKWDVNIFKAGGGLQLAGSVDEDPGDESGLQKLISDFPDCVLLMKRDLFESFYAACEAVGAGLEMFHYDGVLSTS